MSLDMAQRAHLLLLGVCSTQGPDWETSRADARTAVSLAHGVPAEFIDSLGYDRTEAAYLDVRASWAGFAAMHGWSDTYDRPGLEAAQADWLAARPDLATGDDWLSPGWEAHLARYPAGGCGRPTCGICQPVTLLEAS